jgi:hypothetical protein
MGSTAKAVDPSPRPEEMKESSNRRSTQIDADSEVPIRVHQRPSAVKNNRSIRDTDLEGRIKLKESRF